ncbi:TonB-dependent receptor [Roseiterribacter gracilis]|uniref:Oar protein n=1 Tax=Roseiterribacter gracilis TaxID=2812848 RepID=A0A8S8XIM8_9PROT|nr:Oar protein [Rhodospirillales bacterium TMPK1]
MLETTSAVLRRHLFILKLGVAPLALGAAMFAMPAYAQETTGIIQGQVLTGAGAPAAGASVEVTHVPTGTRSVVTTNADGRFNAPNLRPGGPYTIRATGPGVTAAPVTDISADVGSPTVITIGTAPRAAGIEEVVVTARRGTKQVMGSSTAFTQSQIQEQPTVTRDIKDIIRRDPKVVIDPTNSGAIQIAGTNNRFNRLTIDGVSLQDDFGLNGGGYPTQRQPIPLDAVEQMQVMTAPFDVEYSGFQGGVINIQTKSGSNDYHGGAFYYYSSDSLSGKKSGSQDNLISPYTNKTYGGYVSGPIIKDKLFVFFSYEKFDSQTPVLFGPADGGFGNRITGVTSAEVAQVSSIAKSVYGYDTLGLGAGQLPEQDEKILGKVDWNITDQHRASFTFIRNEGNNFIDPDSSTSSNRLALQSNWYNRTQVLNAYALQIFSDWTSDFSTELKAARKEVDSLRPPLGALTVGEVRVRTPTGGQIYFGPDFSSQSNILNTTTDTLKAKAKYTWGPHTFTGGYEREQNDYFNLFIQGSLGVYTFNSISDFQARRLGQFQYNNAFDNVQDHAAAKFGYALNSFYVQDKYDVTPDLTLLFGLRYEVYENTDKPAFNQGFFNRVGFSNQQTLDGKDIWQPRFGFNYKLTQNTNIRGGAGLFSTLGPAVWISNSYSNDGVTQRSLNITAPTSTTAPRDPVLDNATLTVPDRAKTLLAGGDGPVNTIDPNFKTPSSWRFNLGADHRFDNGVGVMVDALFTQVNNGILYKDKHQRQIGTAPDGRPIYGFIDTRGATQNDLVLSNTDKGHGFVLSAGVEKTWDMGAYGELYAQGSYAYQHIKEIEPATSSVANSNFEQFTTYDPNNPALATSNYETRHRVTANLSWSKRFFGDSKTTFSLFYEAREGQPYSFTFTCSATANPFGDTACARGGRNRDLFYVPTGASDPRVNFGAAGSISASVLDAYIVRNGLDPYRGQIAPRNAFYSPWTHRLDGKITQEIPSFWDGHAVELSLDIFNLTNLINKNWGRIEQQGFFYAADTGITPSIGADGKYVYTGTPRDQTNTTSNRASVWQIQIGAKYRF